LDDTDRYEVNRPLTLMNHTQCECKCGKTEQQCEREGKVKFFILKWKIRKNEVLFNLDT